MEPHDSAGMSNHNFSSAKKWLDTLHFLLTTTSFSGLVETANLLVGVPIADGGSEHIKPLGEPRVAIIDHRFWPSFLNIMN